MSFILSKILHKWEIDLQEFLVATKEKVEDTWNIMEEKMIWMEFYMFKLDILIMNTENRNLDSQRRIRTNSLK